MEITVYDYYHSSNVILSLLSQRPSLRACPGIPVRIRSLAPNGSSSNNHLLSWAMVVKCGYCDRRDRCIAMGIYVWIKITWKLGEEAGCC